MDVNRNNAKLLIGIGLNVKPMSASAPCAEGSWKKGMRGSGHEEAVPLAVETHDALLRPTVRLTSGRPDAERGGEGGEIKKYNQPSKLGPCLFEPPLPLHKDLFYDT